MMLIAFSTHSDAENQAPPSDIQECQDLLSKEQAYLAQLRLQIAKKNRQIVVIQRQLDNIPDRAELAQYQRRFIELYNQGELCIKMPSLMKSLFHSFGKTPRNKTVLHIVQHTRRHKTLYGERT